MFPHFFPACLWFGVILLPWIEEISFRGGEMARWAETFPRTKTSFGPPVPTGKKQKISLVIVYSEPQDSEVPGPASSSRQSSSSGVG